MTTNEAIKKLKYYQRWRMGDNDDLPMPDPKEISKAIEFAIKELEEIEQAINVGIKEWNKNKQNES